MIDLILSYLILSYLIYSCLHPSSSHLLLRFTLGNLKSSLCCDGTLLALAELGQPPSHDDLDPWLVTKKGITAALKPKLLAFQH